MESTAAQATFIEITFGVNTFFAVYRHFRDYFRANVDDKIREYEAEAKTIEPKHDEVTRLNAVKTAISKYAAQHLKAQHLCVHIATVLSVVAAISCLAIVFWDLPALMGHHTGWFILPMPTYFGVSGANYGIFRVRGWWKLRQFRKFISEFEPTIPPEFPTS